MESFKTIIDNKAFRVDTTENLLKDVTSDKENILNIKDFILRDPIVKRNYFTTFEVKYYLNFLRVIL